ncbi:MAG: hypothetical protein B7C54_08230 [Acidimicrobiales bacterium mtb01]|nr:hypothetical protein [Actinomycetota bacterium]TEX45101.1 MAG: hypothetical protein B7C54_08230 [Acidimicrobiales bacterium mtb01]
MRNRFARPAIAGILVVAVAVWWWWPGLADRSTTVLIVGGERLAEGREPVDRRLRENGFTTEWTPVAMSWCDVADLLTDGLDGGSFRAAVLAPSSDDTCVPDTDLVDAVRDAGDLRLAVVDWPDTSPVEREFVVRLGSRSDVEVVDIGRLLGDTGSEVDCLWWDDCPNSGRIVAWDADGLTESGNQRVARMIVAAVR